MTQRHQKSEWTGTNEPTPRTIKRALKENERMKKKIIKERLVATDRGFHFTHNDIRHVLHDIYRTPWGRDDRSAFMVFAFGVLRYHGKAHDLRDLQPEHFDAVGFAFTEKLIDLRKAAA